MNPKGSASPGLRPAHAFRSGRILAGNGPAYRGRCGRERPAAPGFRPPCRRDMLRGRSVPESVDRARYRGDGSPTPLAGFGRRGRPARPSIVDPEEEEDEGSQEFDLDAGAVPSDRLRHSRDGRRRRGDTGGQARLREARCRQARRQAGRRQAGQRQAAARRVEEGDRRHPQDREGFGRQARPEEQEAGALLRWSEGAAGLSRGEREADDDEGQEAVRQPVQGQHLTRQGQDRLASPRRQGRQGRGLPLEARQLLLRAAQPLRRGRSARQTGQGAVGQGEGELRQDQGATGRLQEEARPDAGQGQAEG